MADIWDEIKLESITHESDLDPLRVKTYLKKLKEHIDWLQSYVDANQLIVNQFAFHDEKYWWNGVDLTEMEEKADRLDKLLESAAGANLERLLENTEKIESVRTWLTKAKAQGYISISQGEKLDEILGVDIQGENVNATG